MTRAGADRAGWFVHPAVDVERIVVWSMCVFCAGLWLGSVNLLVSSSWRDGGRVLSCVHFDGVRLKEHQYGNTPNSPALACPMFKPG